MIKAVVFDFDGVLVESVDVKTNAFATLFQDEGEEVARKVVAYHLDHGGISRFEKFRYYYAHFLKRPLTAEKERELADRFAALVLDAVIRSPYVPGALDSLRLLHGRKIPLYVASGTPEGELRHIVKERGIGHFFEGVFGAPRTKGDILAAILKERGISPSEAVMVGDAMTDYDAALETGVQFIGRVNGAHNPFAGKEVNLLSDLSPLYKMIANLPRN